LATYKLRATRPMMTGKAYACFRSLRGFGMRLFGLANLRCRRDGGAFLLPVLCMDATIRVFSCRPAPTLSLIAVYDGDTVTNMLHADCIAVGIGQALYSIYMPSFSSRLARPNSRVAPLSTAHRQHH